MIVKTNDAPQSTDRFGRAGRQAEDQMAFYLNRAFGESSDVFVFHNLRIEREGAIAQIDHLVLHRYGFVIVESKSVTGIVTVNRQGEFSRIYGDNTFGMKSPIVQALMQRDVLQNLLNDHKEQLRRKVLFGLKQAFFSSERFAVLVAISDSGVIDRQGIDPPELMKADAVAGAIRAKIELHGRTGGFGGVIRMAFAGKQEARELERADLVPFEPFELETIGRFLIDRHKPATALATDNKAADSAAIEVGNTSTAKPVETTKFASTPRDARTPSNPGAKSGNAEFSCKHCTGKNLRVAYGKYGYYFKCQSCQGNSRIDFTCSNCGKQARIRKDANEFAKVCDACNANEHFFSNRD